MPEPVVLFAIIDVAEADAANLRASVSELARQSRAEAGCLRYDVHQSTKTPVRLVLHEAWISSEALEAHRASAHVERFRAAISGTSASVWASPFLLSEDR